MMDFVRKLADRVIGVLSGFDRLLFRGMLRSVVDARGLNGYLYGAGVPMTNFKEHAQEVTSSAAGRIASVRPGDRLVKFDTCKAVRNARKTWLRKSPSGMVSGTG